METIKLDDYSVEFNDDPEVRDAVFIRVMQYFANCETFSGEAIMQCDDSIISAPDVMGDIADNIIKFKTIWE